MEIVGPAVDQQIGGAARADAIGAGDGGGSLDDAGKAAVLEEERAVLGVAAGGRGDVDERATGIADIDDDVGNLGADDALVLRGLLEFQVGGELKPADGDVDGGSGDLQVFVG